MVLESQRKNIDPVLSGISRHFSKVNPDVFTWISVVFAFLAGLFFFFSSPQKELFNFYLYAAALFVFLNGLFDAMDGKIAKIANISEVTLRSRAKQIIKLILRNKTRKMEVIKSVQ